MKFYAVVLRDKKQQKILPKKIIKETFLTTRAYTAAGHDYQVIAVRWIPVGGYQNLAQGHRQLGGKIVAKFIKRLVQQYGKNNLRLN